MKHLINQRLVSINNYYYHHYNVKVIVKYLGQSGVPKLLCEEPVRDLMILAMNQYVLYIKAYTVYREIFAALSFCEIKIREKYFRE